MTPTKDEDWDRRRNELIDGIQELVNRLRANSKPEALLAPKPAPRRWIATIANDFVAEYNGEFKWITGDHDRMMLRDLQVPSMEELVKQFYIGRSMSPEAGIHAVLAACGLEVGKP